MISPDTRPRATLRLSAAILGRFVVGRFVVGPFVVGTLCLLAYDGPAAAQSPAVLPHPAPPAPQISPAPAPKPSVAAAEVIDRTGIEGVIGRSVRSSSGEDLGRIIDLLVTPAGQARAAVIDFGGVLGVGSRKVAVDWRAIDFGNLVKDGTVRLELSRDQVRMAPEYKAGDPVVVLQPPARADDKTPLASDKKPPQPASSMQGAPAKP